ncbi:MAG: class IV adenylate cyclase [Methanosarcinaceae archaeon]|nr:class IV adenylate cyclase [Methanosarcinaceae archaeon]
MIEIEVKVRAEHTRIRPFLEMIGAEKVKVEEQSDTYFAAPYRDFAKTDEALRIRTLDGKSILTYKGPKLDTVSKSRKEFETFVEEENSVQILHALGFSEAGAVRKVREVFRAEEITVCLDSVEGLGEFLEVEIVARDESELEASRARLFEFLGRLGLGEADSIRTSYLEMVLENQTH